MFPRRACASQDGCSIDNPSAGGKSGVLGASPLVRLERYGPLRAAVTRDACPYRDGETQALEREAAGAPLPRAVTWNA